MVPMERQIGMTSHQLRQWKVMDCLRWDSLYYYSPCISPTNILKDFGQDLEGLDLTNIAGWDLDAFWDF